MARPAVSAAVVEVARVAVEAGATKRAVAAALRVSPRTVRRACLGTLPGGPESEPGPVTRCRASLQRQLGRVGGPTFWAAMLPLLGERAAALEAELDAARAGRFVDDESD